MINLDNFKKVPSWPTTAFMYGHNILSEDCFNTLLNAKFTETTSVDSAYPNRKYITVDDIKKSNIEPTLAKCLLDLKSYTNNHELLKTLFSKAFENEEFPITRFWHHGLKAIEYYQRNVHIMFAEDPPGISMAPHVDHREVLANLQVYISPNDPTIGTTWYKHDNYAINKMSSFIPNSGYFSVNTNQSVHSFGNTSSNLRRSIIISWTM